MTRFLLLVLIAAAGLVVAQPATPSPAEALESKPVSELLAASDPARLAWGAYRAGNESRQDLTGELLRLVVHPDRRVRLAAFDALLRLDVAIPEETLNALARVNNRLDEVLIVIARHRGKYGRLIDDLLHRRDELRDVYWEALHGILAEDPHVSLAAMLLKEWTIRLYVPILDRHTVPKSSDGGTLQVEGGSSFDSPGFPPLVRYAIIVGDSPACDVRLVKRGPHLVGYRIQKAPDRQSSRTIDRNLHRAAYLADLAGERPLDSSDLTLRIDWKSEADFRTRVADRLRGLSEAVRRLKQRLVERKLLDAAEAKTLLPKLEVQVSDVRGGERPPLPAMAWVLTP